MMKQFKAGIVGIALFVAGGVADAAIDLHFTPRSQTADAIEIGLNISGLGDDALGTYDFNIQFDPTRLAFAGVVFGDPVLGDELDVFDLGGNSTAADVLGPGVLNLFESSLDNAADLQALQADSFTLAIIRFEVLSGGSSQLGLLINGLADAGGDGLSANTAPLTINPVAAVPLPGMVWPMVGGFWVVLRWRRS
ncbi:cohesin domain-containing protein [Methylomonas sp. OY6]|uniref:Cohesin domain-containing protein n=1 Tax=Methylomonas defluvii TaxID=3045149 RepID=A0ABU4UFY7_9GAMM|nr:cohesin domain-containing protein [Methylomonas sp. OY6]MDX8128280.1 cohesin domain-containing protein [Methylomonas sp. OY6]